MAALDFPSSPTPGQTYTANGKTYTYDSATSSWLATNVVTVPISTGVSGLGTGVATALGVNVGSAGAPVLFNGAGGTPTSLTLTNASGLPVSTGVSGLGTGVATALGVNVGSAGAPVVNGGALGTPSSGTLTNATGLPLANTTSALNGIIKCNGSSVYSVAASGTDYQAPIGTISGIAKGNGANALTAAVAGTDYVAPTANGLWNLLATLTAASSVSLTDTTNLTSTYANYALVLTNILPATAATTLQLQARVSAAYQTSGYVGAVTGNANGTTQGWTMSANVQLSRSNDVATTNGGVSGIVYISNPSSATTVKVWNWQIGYYANGSFFATAEGSAAYTAATTAITGFQLLFSSGNIASGTVKIYGWN